MTQMQIFIHKRTYSVIHALYLSNNSETNNADADVVTTDVPDIL